jgi:hypothetical protein
MNNSELKKNINDLPPTIFKSWKRLYGIVFLNLVILVLLFYLFTKAFE